MSDPSHPQSPRPSLSPAQTLLLRHAPVIPQPVLAAALAQVNAWGADSQLLPALLSRPDLPLDTFTTVCEPTSGLSELAAAAYIARSEHPPARVAELLDADDRTSVRSYLLRARHASDAVRLAALRSSPLNAVRSAVRDSRQSATVRAAAVNRWLELIGQLPEKKAATERKSLMERLDTAVAECADALALCANDRDVLAKVSRHLRTREAADRVAEVFLGPALRAEPHATRPFDEVLYASHRLSALCSPHVGAQLATWWEDADLARLLQETGGDQPASPRMYQPLVADLVARLRGGGLDERIWQLAREYSDESRASDVELAAHLAAAFGDDPGLWAVYLRVADRFAGTVRQLIDTVRAINTSAARS